MQAGALEVWTVGHSNHSGADFIRLLQAHGIECVADVRRFPGSRRHPQFGADPLAQSLREHGIEYAWLQELGGRRRGGQDDAGSAWRNASFRAYAAHLATDEFALGLERLLHMAAACRTAMMCSEVLWWRCHRSLVSDVLRFSGHTVLHILGEHEVRPHPYTSPARIVQGELVYSAEPPPCCEGHDTR